MCDACFDSDFMWLGSKPIAQRNRQPKLIEYNKRCAKYRGRLRGQDYSSGDGGYGGVGWGGTGACSSRRGVFFWLAGSRY